MKVAVIGAGSWGTALANTLALGGNEVCMWARKPEVAASITDQHRNPRYLSDVELEASIVATTSLEEAIQGAGAVVLVTHYLEDIIPEIDRVVLVKDARIIADGPKAEILTSRNMAALFDIPAEVREADGYYSLHANY